jgi:hypothetical protein
MANSKADKWYLKFNFNCPFSKLWLNWCIRVSQSGSSTQSTPKWTIYIVRGSILISLCNIYPPQRVTILQYARNIQRHFTISVTIFLAYFHSTNLPWAVTKRVTCLIIDRWTKDAHRWPHNISPIQLFVLNNP